MRIPWNKGKKTGPLSQEHRAKIGLGITGRKVSVETREKLRASNVGKKRSLQTRKRIGLSKIGKLPTNNQLKALSIGWGYFKGKTHSEETKNKISKVIQKKIEDGWKNKVWFKKGVSQRVGDKHWNWKGGITKKDHSQRVLFRRTIHKLVLERDNYTCVLCGKRGELQVDHIEKWADNPDKRLLIDNCRTLCVYCHYMVTFNKPMPKTTKEWGRNLLERRSR